MCVALLSGYLEAKDYGDKSIDIKSEELGQSHGLSWSKKIFRCFFTFT